MIGNEAEPRRLARSALVLMAGVTLGLALGLYVGWFAWPTQYSDADLTILEASYQYDVALMTAQAYGLDGDLAAARLRLEALGDRPPYDWYRTLLLDGILAGRPETELRHLARLGQALGIEAPAPTPYLAEPG